MVVRFAVIAALVAVALPGGSTAQNRRLLGTVGPGFTIALTEADGSRVTQLEPGTYEIVVEDRGDEHNFHLTGPGVDQSTGVDQVGTVTWTVTVTAGTYRYVCDPHALQMRGSFNVGTPAPQPQPQPQPQQPATPSAPAAARLSGSVGPGFTISLRTPAGRAVRSVKAGRVTIAVRDRSPIHNFHLTGPGVNRRTSVPFVGSATWRLRLQKGRTYRFVCDPHARTMRGSFRAR